MSATSGKKNDGQPRCRFWLTDLRNSKRDRHRVLARLKSDSGDKSSFKGREMIGLSKTPVSDGLSGIVNQ